MKRNFALVVALLLVFGLAVMSASPRRPRPRTRSGCVAIKKGQPIHIAYWMVVAGADASLGIDTRRGVEIAIQDKGGKLLGYPIKLSGQDTGCNAEGGQAAATKLASDPTIVAAVGSNCSSEARPGAPILWKAGIATVSPSNTAPYLTDPKRGKEYDGYLRTAHNDKIQGAVAAEFAFKKLGVKTAATDPRRQRLRRAAAGGVRRILQKAGRHHHRPGGRGPDRHRHAPGADQDRHRQARVHLLPDLHRRRRPSRPPGKGSGRPRKDRPDERRRDLLPGLLQGRR